MILLARWGNRARTGEPYALLGLLSCIAGILGLQRSASMPAPWLPVRRLACMLGGMVASAACFVVRSLPHAL